MAVIYSLIDPRGEEIRYVGKTVNHPLERLYWHVQRPAHTHCGTWIRGLKIEGLFPQIQILQEVPEQFVDDAERFWIAHLRNNGVRLTNMTEGGSGGPTMTGRKLTPEWKSNIGAGNRGKKHSKATKRLWSKQRKGHAPWNKGLNNDE